MLRLDPRVPALFVVWASFTSPALAYLDPATGSIIVQAIIGAVATWVMYSRLYAAKAKALILRLVRGRAHKETE